MIKEELLKVFDYLEKTINQDKLLYFKLLDVNQIGAYWKVDNKHFADFYIKPILKIIRNGNNNE